MFHLALPDFKQNEFGYILQSGMNLLFKKSGLGSTQS